MNELAPNGLTLRCSDTHESTERRLSIWKEKQAARQRVFSLLEAACEQSVNRAKARGDRWVV